MSSFSCLPGQVRSVGLVLALFLLVACGGGSGGGSDKPPSPTLPPSVEEEPGGNAGDDNQAGDDSDKHWVRATEYTDGSLPLIGTHRAVDAQRGKIFVLDSEAQRVDVVDLVSGQRESYFEFKDRPEHLTLSADGDALYVALNTPSVVTLDLDRLAYDPEAVFDLSFQPQRLIATLDNHLDNRVLVYRAFEEGRNKGHLALYDPASGEQLDNVAFDTIAPMEFVRAPLSTDVWASSNFNELYLIRVTADSIELEGEQRSVGAAFGEKSWITADGNFIIVSPWGAMLATDLIKTDMLKVASWLQMPEMEQQEGVEVRAEIIGVATDSEVITVYTEHTLTATEFPYDIGRAYFAATYNAQSMQLIDYDELTDRVVGGSYFQGKLYHQVTVDGVTTQTVQADHPCPACSENSKPEASFTFVPEQVYTDIELTVDASASTDKEDPNNLLYRWNFWGDGLWGGKEFTDDPVATHTYFTPGTYNVDLQVKDSLGLVSETTIEIEVIQRPREAEEVDQEQKGLLEFRAGQSAFDSSTGTVYLSEDGGTRLYWVDLHEERATHVLEFGQPIIQLWLSPFSHRLYVLFGEGIYLLSGENLTVVGAQPGSYLAAVDTNSREHVVTWRMLHSIHDFVVTEEEAVIYSTGQTHAVDHDIWVHKPGEGHVSIESPGGADLRLRFHPHGDILYSFSGRPPVWQPWIPPQTVAYEIKGGVLERIGDHESTANRPVGGNAWVCPDGRFLFTRAGVVLDSVDFSLQATILDRELTNDYIREVQCAADASFAVITLESGQVLKASGDSYGDVEVVEGINDAYRAYPHEGEIRVFIRTENTAQLVQ